MPTKCTGPTLRGHRQITDSYLLGLAVRHQYRYVSFDARLNLHAVPGAKAEHLIVLSPQWVRLEFKGALRVWSPILF